MEVCLIAYQILCAIMQTAFKILKWITFSILLLLVAVLLSGLVFLLVTPAASPPMGRLVDIGGTRLHINSAGEKSAKPTLVIEAGGGLPTEFYYWIDHELRDSVRVIRYDRAGLGHSDPCRTPRDPETIAHELHNLLEAAGESPPYILMGHSLGGPYQRVFAELYPNEVVAMFFLDATHPDHVELYNAPKKTDLIYKVYMISLGVQGFLADVGVLALYDKIFGTPYFGEGLPAEQNQRIKEFLRSGKSFRTHKEEMEYYYDALERSGEKEDFGSMPIREFSAVLKKRKPATLKTDSARLINHKRYAHLSNNGKLIEIEANHVTIFSKRENAAIICDEVLDVMRELDSF